MAHLTLTQQIKDKVVPGGILSFRAFPCKDFYCKLVPEKSVAKKGFYCFH